MAVQVSPSRCAELVARAVRICNDADVMGTQGHCSMRDPDDANVMWINNRHSSRSTIRADEIVPYDIAAGKRIGEGIEPPSEHWIHRELYLRFPKVHGVVHSHPEKILALSCAGHVLRTLITSATFIPEAGAPVFDSAVLINTEVRSKGMADAMGTAPIVVLRQHGTVTVGRSLEEAVTRMVRAEKNADAQARAIAAGTPRFFAGSERAGLVAESGDGLHGIKKFWTFLEETAEHNGAFVGLD
jgi:ribulose-5-phosphate 4-epimerase/fuculose-1-phosphate aldolase